MSETGDEAEGTGELSVRTYYGVEFDGVTGDIVTDGFETGARRKAVILIGMLVAMLIAGGLYLLWARARVSEDLADRNERAQATIDEFEAAQSAAAASATPTPIPAAAAGFAPQPGEVLVINRVPGDDYGKLAIRHADGTRTLLERRCMRIHISADHGVCVSENAGLITTFTTTFFEAINPDVEIKSYPSALPSRARISPDGSLATVTAFVTGTSYADIGTGESTTIVTIDEIDSTRLVRGTTTFAIDSDEPRFGNLDPQYWGITFSDDNDFYITGHFGDEPEILHGSLEAETFTPTGYWGSCPSLSPDGKTLVYKGTRDDGGYDLIAVDLDSGESWQLGETRSVDDQVEWLDNDTILYGLHPDGGNTAVQPEWDIWSLDIAPGSEPMLFLPNADSPAVVR